VYDAWRAKAKQARAFTRVRLDQVPEDLGKVLATMQNGETTKVPVKSQFGWHVVHLDIVNPYSPPEFDQVKEGIRRNAQMKITRERMDKLRKEAKIEYPPGAAPPSSAPAAGNASPTQLPAPPAGLAIPAANPPPTQPPAPNAAPETPQEKKG
jgi:hypothetical protein